MLAAWKVTERTPIREWIFRNTQVTLPVRTEASFQYEASLALLRDASATVVKRNNAAFQLAWLARQSIPLDVSSIQFGPNGPATLHLPGEPFIEYQLAAQTYLPSAKVCAAGYGDGGPGYIPTESAFLEGGYEPTVALCAPQSESILMAAIKTVLNVNE
jgi:hypothetical protein